MVLLIRVSSAVSTCPSFMLGCKSNYTHFTDRYILQQPGVLEPHPSILPNLSLYVLLPTLTREGWGDRSTLCDAHQEAVWPVIRTVTIQHSSRVVWAEQLASGHLSYKSCPCEGIKKSLLSPSLTEDPCEPFCRLHSILAFTGCHLCGPLGP